MALPGYMCAMMTLWLYFKKFVVKFRQAGRPACGAAAMVRGSEVYDARRDGGDAAQLDPRVVARWPSA